MSEAGEAATPTGAWARWRSTVLVASLALNLLVVGVIATAAVRAHFSRPHGPAGQASLFAYARMLPQQRRQEIWSTTREERQRLRSVRGELRQLRDEMRATLQADPFDADRFKAAHHKLNEAESTARVAARALFEKFVIALSPGERKEFVRLQPPLDGGWHRRPGPPPPPGGPDDDMPPGPPPGK